MRENKWKWLSKIYDTKNNNTSSQMPLDHWSLLYIRFVAVTFRLWRRSPLEKGPILTYYGPSLPSIHPWADLWSLLYIRFVAVAFQLWWRSPLEKGPSFTYYDLALDRPLAGFGPKVNTNVWCHEFFIPTKSGKYPSSDSVVKADCIPIHILVQPPPPLFTLINK